MKVGLLLHATSMLIPKVVAVCSAAYENQVTFESGYESVWYPDYDRHCGSFHYVPNDDYCGYQKLIAHTYSDGGGLRVQPVHMLQLYVDDVEITYTKRTARSKWTIMDSILNLDKSYRLVL